MMTNDTVRKMNELKLFGMAHAFTAQVESANATHLSFEERIGLIIDHEVTYRDDKRLRRLLAGAKLREQAQEYADADVDRPLKLAFEVIESVAQAEAGARQFAAALTALRDGPRHCA